MQAFTNARIFDGERILDGRALLVEHGVILGVVKPIGIPATAEWIDLQGKLLAPAFIDLQVNGGNGKLFAEHPSVEALEATRQSCLEGGTTLFLPTVVTNEFSVFYRAIEAVKAYWKKGGLGVPGLHVEGPYLNPEKRGAHMIQYIKRPEIAEVKELLAAGKGVIKMITLAPEVCSEEVIELILESGIVISAGHSNATYEEGMRAFQRGIKVGTHLFNAMSGLHHRSPGLIGAFFDSDAVSSIVVDGYHVDFPVVRFSKKIMGERLFLVTDTVAENREGHYLHRFDGDKYILPDGTFSGAALSMFQAVRNCVEKVGIELGEALRMASLYPARVLAMDHLYGRIQAGYKAEMVVVDERLEGVDVLMG
jgi:N-acetylglucosamine-6-phosphate deacetylase